MTEPRAPYTTHAAQLTPDDIHTLAHALAGKMRLITHTMPHYKFREEDWRKICQAAVEMLYEESEGEP